MKNALMAVILARYQVTVINAPRDTLSYIMVDVNNVIANARIADLEVVSVALKDIILIKRPGFAKDAKTCSQTAILV